MEIAQDQMTIYRATAQRRFETERKQLSERYDRAWALAREGADILRNQFGANHVMVFGSLLHRELFHTRSDVDIAVWGLDEKKYYRAVAHLLSLDPDIQTDLVMADDMSEALRLYIEREGVPI